ncbi:hypothetical protein TcWFU_003694 [Taenia crassiceps]|uniref:Uncharacterized protein n=1 Tax=Taenia crassiceps TaxID=6207 RepID=A0ABR4Q725_9CEST
MLRCKVCGGSRPLRDAQISSDCDLCKHTMQLLLPAGDGIKEGLELLHLQSRQFELQDKVTGLVGKMHRLDAAKPMEHDVDDHLKSHTLAVHRPAVTTLNSAPRINPSILECVGPSQLTHCGTSSSAFDQARMWPGTAPEGQLNLRDLREEIATLHRKFDEELKSMREVLLGNTVGMARPFEKSKAAAETEGKENSEPGTILSEAQQVLLDATRRRRMFETSVANCERSRAQRNVFNILGRLDDGDSDVLRIRALIDDAVNDLAIPQKPISIPPKVVKPSSLARLSASKQSKIASRQPQKSTKQRPLSLPATFIAAAPTSRGRSTGLADLVDFSTPKSTTAPLMKRPKVVLPSNITPRVDSQVEKHEKSVRFEETYSRPRSTPRATSFVPPSIKKKALVFLPLGMRQYSMRPTEENQMFTSSVPQMAAEAKTTAVDSGMEKEKQAPKQPILSSASQQPQPTSEANLTSSDLREILDAALKDYLARRMPLTECYQVHSQVRDVNVGICSQDFMKEEALSPIHSPANLTLIDRASSLKPIAESQEMVSRGNSVQFVEKPRSSSLPSISSEVIVTSEKLRTESVIEAEASTEFLGSNHIATAISTERSDFSSEWAQSPILADAEEVSAPPTLTEVEEGEKSGEREGFSLTEPHTFSDGVWLDADRSEGEPCGVATFGAEGVADLAREVGPLPSWSEITEITNSTSEAIKNCSEGEFTLGQVNYQLGVWVAPWRDPVLHLIALNAAGKNSRLPWNQQHKIQKVARILERHDDNKASYLAKTYCSSTEDLSWVEDMATRMGATSPPSTATDDARSVGEVVPPIPVKQQLKKQQLRRTILAKSSHRMHQHDTSLSDEEDTLGGEVGETPAGKLNFLLDVKSLSDEESKEIKKDEIDGEGSLESQIDSTLKGDSTFEMDPDVFSNFLKGSL